MISKSKIFSSAAIAALVIAAASLTVTDSAFAKGGGGKGMHGSHMGKGRHFHHGRHYRGRRFYGHGGYVRPGCFKLTRRGWVYVCDDDDDDDDDE